MADIAIAVSLCILTLATAYLGVHLTMHPAESSKAKRAYKIAFCVCGIGACVLIGWQARRAQVSAASLSSALTRIEANTKTPPSVSVTNTVPPAQVVIQGPPTVASSISSSTEELPIETFASHGLPTTETYITAHGTVTDPTFVLECNSACAYETAMSLSTGTLPESKQLSPTRIRVHFVIPAQLSDGQQVAIRVRSESHEPIHAIKVRRVAK